MTEKRKAPEDDQHVVEWFNNELAVWRAKWDRLDKHFDIEESIKEFQELIDEAKEYENIRTIKSFNAGFHCGTKENNNKESFFED